MRVLACAADPSSTITRIRLADPLQAVLAADGGELKLRPLHATPRQDMAWASVLVVQRGTSRRHLSLMRTAAALGAAVIYEIDDLLTEPARHLTGYDAMQQSRRWVLAGLDAADVVTVSTPRLAALLGLPEHRHVIVPNAAFPGTADAPLPKDDPRGPVTVLVAASDRVAGQAAWQALAAVQQEGRIRMTVRAVGPVADDLAAAGVQCECLPLMPRDRFVQWARAQPQPLALIPLDDSPFSAGKSAVKWFDLAEAGVPTLASDAGPYHDVIEHDRTGGLVGAENGAWQRALQHALVDAAWRRRIAIAAREHVRRQHGAAQTTGAWRAALDMASQRAAARGPRRAPQPAWLDAVASRADEALLQLRRWNRERLSRRHP